MIEIKNEFELSSLTSWQVGGPAEFFAMPASVEEINECIQWSKDRKQPITILGGGSNVLISDRGIRGLVVCLKKVSGILDLSDENNIKLECLTGTSKSELLKVFLKYRQSPALFLAGLPGDVGGGVVMNAGVAEAFVPREFSEIIDWVEVIGFDLKVRRFSKDQLRWTYRHSDGWGSGVISKVGVRWQRGEDPTILEKVREANRVRLSKQPLDLPSCGSVFKNPEGFKAAQLIDQCGLKGFKVGNAEVSRKHANFIVNLGGAKASDILAVIEKVKKVVWDQKAIALQTEVVKFGDF